MAGTSLRPFSAETAKWNEESSRAFLLEGEADEDLAVGRLMVFVCSECGDLGCGAITCEIVRGGDSFVWRSFAYENGYDSDMTDFESYSQIGPFRFSVEEYRRAIEKQKTPNKSVEATANAAPHLKRYTVGKSQA